MRSGKGPEIVAGTEHNTFAESKIVFYSPFRLTCETTVSVEAAVNRLAVPSLFALWPIVESREVSWDYAPFEMLTVTS
jgi:hypothetical protein